MNSMWLWSRVCSAVEAGEVPLALAVELSDENSTAEPWASLRDTDYETLLRVTANLPRRAEVTAVDAATMAPVLGIENRSIMRPNVRALRHAAQLLRRYQDPENEKYAYDEKVSFNDVLAALVVVPDHSLWAWEALAQALDIVGFRRGEPTIDPSKYKGRIGPRRVRNIIDYLARMTGVPGRDLMGVMKDFGPPTIAEVVDAVESGWGRA